MSDNRSAYELRAVLSDLQDRYDCNTAIMHARTKSLEQASLKLKLEKEKSSKLRDHLTKATKACRAAKAVLDGLPYPHEAQVIPSNLHEPMDRARRRVNAVCAGVFDRAGAFDGEDSVA